MLLAPFSAYAAGGVGGKGETGGKGGNGPSAGPSGGGGGFGSGGGLTSETRSQNADKSPEDTAVTQKPWEVGGTWETHRLIRQEDLGGAGYNKLVNVLGAYARYDLTANDRIGLRDYFYERFVADAGETGLRSDDLTATYTRTQYLPEQFTFQGSLWLTAPTSFSSQKQGLITSPTVVLQLDKRLGRYVTVSARALGIAFISKYRVSEGGSANPKYRMGGTLEGEVAMPFHEALSLGADVATSYVWYYNVGDEQNRPTTQDVNFPNQPIQQRWAAEIFARYTLPPLIGIKSDLTLAFANGDPSLGSASVLHDGVTQVLTGTARQTLEVYAALSVRY
jgi:hypothetical protein